MTVERAGLTVVNGATMGKARCGVA